VTIRIETNLALVSLWCEDGPQLADRWMNRQQTDLCVQIVVQPSCGRGKRQSLRIPIRVRRPSAAREALGFRPLMEAGGGTLLPYRKCSNRARSYKTNGLLWGRPTAKRAADARTRWLPVLLLLNLAIQNTRPGSDIHEVGVPLREQSNAQSSLCNRNGVYLRSPQNPRLGGPLWLPK
jgi:hypothetical protein